MKIKFGDPIYPVSGMAGHFNIHHYLFTMSGQQDSNLQFALSLFVLLACFLTVFPLQRMPAFIHHES